MPAGPTFIGWSQGRAPLPAWVSTTGIPKRRGKLGQLVGGLRVDRPPAGHDERCLGCLDRAHGVGQVRLTSGSGRRTRQTRRSKKRQRPVECLGLDVLGQRDRDRAGLDRIGQHPECRRQRGEQLLRTRDPVEVARDRPEGVVHARVALDRVLDLLEDRVGRPVGEVVAREEQDRDPVDRRTGGAGDHVQGARPDRRDAGVGLQPVVVPGERRGDMDLGLLVLGPVQGHAQGVTELLEGLAQAGHIAVPEDAPEAGDEAALAAIPFGILGGAKTHDGLAHGQPDCVHRASLAQPIAGTVSSRLGPRQHRCGAGAMTIGRTVPVTAAGPTRRPVRELERV